MISPLKGIIPKQNLSDQDAALILSKELITSNSYLHRVKYFLSLKEKKLLQQDNDQNFYIYSVKSANFSLSGIVGLVNISEYDSGKIRPHESIFIDKKKLFIKLFSRYGLQCKPSMLLYEDESKTLDSIFKAYENIKPNLILNYNETTHSLKRINDENSIKQVSIGYSLLNKLWIADGHHRFAAISSSKTLDQVLVMLVNTKQNFKILPFEGKYECPVSNKIRKIFEFESTPNIFSQIIENVNNNGLLPQQSTYFVPRLIDGIIGVLIPNYRNFRFM